MFTIDKMNTDNCTYKVNAGGKNVGIFLINVRVHKDLAK
jgi:hypothetical protein